MKKLLIVDDDIPLLESLRYVFRGLYDVATACSAEEAAGLLARQEVDVMLLDILLPGINGIEFLGKVRKQHPHLPVILISAASTIRPFLKAIELGEADYVHKPFDIDELRLVVARALNLGELRRRVAELETKQANGQRGAELNGRPMKKAIEEFERTLIEKALRRTGGVQTHTAELLGTTRRILRYRMEKLKIPFGEP